MQAENEGLKHHAEPPKLDARMARLIQPPSAGSLKPVQDAIF
jgi:hypothetical protein